MVKKGFTLLEMVVVVIIVSVLFLLTVPNVAKVIDSVDAKACNAMTKVVDSAIAQFKLDYGKMPKNMNELFYGGYISEEQMTCSNGTVLVINDGHCEQE